VWILAVNVKTDLTTMMRHYVWSRSLKNEAVLASVGAVAPKRKTKSKNYTSLSWHSEPNSSPVTNYPKLQLQYWQETDFQIQCSQLIHASRIATYSLKPPFDQRRSWSTSIFSSYATDSESHVVQYWTLFYFAFPLHTWTGPWSSRRLRLQKILDTSH
jgi:hypothetical protein